MLAGNLFTKINFKKIHEHEDVDKEIPRETPPKTKKQRMDYVGIATLTVTIVDFLLAITFIQSIATNLAAFVVPLIIGVISFVIFMKVEKRSKSPLVNLKFEFKAVIATGNIMMLMYGILEYFIITGVPQFGLRLPPSGLGIETRFKQDYYRWLLV